MRRPSPCQRPGPAIRSARRPRPSARPVLPGATAAALFLLLPAARAWADPAVPLATPELPVHLAYEPGLMLLTVTGILAISGMLLRLLARLKVISRLIWFLPILTLVSAAVWAPMYIVNFSGLPNLRTLTGFLFSFSLLVTILYPVSRLLLPSRALLTRGGVPPLLRGMAVVVAAFVGLFILLTWSFPTLSLTPMFITSGVISIILGFALQDLLANLMAGIVMSFERPFQVGDWVRIGSAEGEVLDLTWRVTRIRTRENDCVHIPNNAVAKESVLNFSQPTPEHLVKLHVGVSYETPCGLVEAALLDAAAGVDSLLETPAPRVFLKDFQDSSILYELRVWIDNFESLHAIENEVRRQVWYAFKRSGIVIPFPQRDVNLRRVPSETRKPCCRLVATAGPLAGTLVPLDAAPLTVGRHPDCDLVISDHHVSNQHARIEPCEDGWRLRDLNSRHGTLLNRIPVKDTVLGPGDLIQVGPVTLAFECHGVPASARNAAGFRWPQPAKPASAPPGENPPAPTALS